MPKRPPSRDLTITAPPPTLASVAVGLAALIAYVALACPVAGGKDGGEFVLVLARLGVAHPTGYPLYTLLGHAFVTALHGSGASWAWAANVWSAVGGAVAMGLSHALLARLLAPTLGATRAAAVAVLPLAILALNPVWTDETTLAEVYSWHVAWVAGASLFAQGAVRLLADRASGTASIRGLALGWGLLLGIGAVHHTSSVLFAVPFTVMLAVIAVRAGRHLGELVAVAVIGMLLPLLSLGYVAWHASHEAVVRWPALEPGWRGVLDHVTGAQYRGFLGRFAPSPNQARLLVTEVAPWLMVGVLGALMALRRGDAFRRTLAFAVLLQTAACFLYGVPDPASYFLPPLFMGLVLATRELSALPLVRRQGMACALVAAAIAIASLVHGVTVAQARLRAITGLDALLRRMWASLPEEPGFVVWDDDMAQMLRGYQLLEGAKPRLTVIAPRRLTYPHEYARFKAEHGLDPLAGLSGVARPGDAVAEEAMLAGIEANLNRSPLPVYEFLPRIPSLRRLNKPAVASPDSAGRR